MKRTHFTILLIMYSFLVHAQGEKQHPPQNGNQPSSAYYPDSKNSYTINGEEAIITRLEGVGAGEKFLELADGEYDKILGQTTNGEITYKPGAAPISVQVVNPLNLKEGEYIITFVDPTPDDTLSQNTRWILLNDAGDTIVTADQPITEFNEQLVEDLGISILIKQSDDAGDLKDSSNGTIGYSLSYKDPDKPQWLVFIPDDSADIPILNFIQTDLPTYPNYSLDPYRAYSTFAPWVPFILADTRLDEPVENPLGWNISPGWMDPSGGLIQSPQFGGALQSLNNIDIILTSDKSKWSRCVVVETASDYYTGTTPPSIGLSTEGNKKSLQPRAKPSVGKYDADQDGFPDPDGAVDDNGNPLTGMGWFPGYAVDVETGNRLNIFFGENSTYSGFVSDALGLGDIAHDMIWNPGKQAVLPPTGGITPLEIFLGGQQFVYVTRTKYDSCASLRRNLDRTGLVKARALSNVTWCAIPLTIDGPGIDLLPLNEGLIPNEVTIKLRVDNPYQLATGNGQYHDYPTYRFKLEGASYVEEPAFKKSSFILYPNPTNTNITIETKNERPGKETISIFNTEGKTMMTNKYLDQSRMEMDVCSLAPGIYFVELRTASGRETKKMIVQ